eukprot:scpid101274/ scgid29013/ 
MGEHRHRACNLPKAMLNPGYCTVNQAAPAWTGSANTASASRSRLHGCKQVPTTGNHLPTTEFHMTSVQMKSPCRLLCSLVLVAQGCTSTGHVRILFTDHGVGSFPNRDIYAQQGGA